MGSNHTSLAVISLDSALKKMRIIIPKCFQKTANKLRKKVIRRINDNSSSSSSSDESDDSDEE